MVLTEAASGLSPRQLDEFRREGFVVVRNVFTEEEISELSAESERLLNAHYDLVSPDNLRCRFMPHHVTGESLFEVFDPVRWTDRRHVANLCACVAVGAALARARPRHPSRSGTKCLAGSFFAARSQSWHTAYCVVGG